MPEPYLSAPPPGVHWQILEVMRQGTWPAKPGRPRNVWCALLIDVDPDEYCAGHCRDIKIQWCKVALGRHKTRYEAWCCAEDILAERKVFEMTRRLEARASRKAVARGVL